MNIIEFYEKLADVSFEAKISGLAIITILAVHII